MNLEKIRAANRVRAFQGVVYFAVFNSTTWLINDSFVNNRWAAAAIMWSDASPEIASSSALALWATRVCRGMVVVIGFRFRETATLTFVRSWHLLLFALLFCESVCTSDDSDPHWLAYTATERVGLSALLSEPFLTLIINVVISVTYFLCHSSVPLNQFMQMQVPLVVLSFVIPWMFTTIVANNNRTALELQALREERQRASLEAQMLRTAGGLLSTICDAVVHLGEDLRIKGPSPSLAGLLLQSSGKAFAGCLFPDLSANAAEAERVLDFLRRDEEGSGSLHASLRDSNASIVNVQLYHVRGLDVDDRVFHVVGVCEDVESFREPPAASMAATLFGQPRGWSNQTRAHGVGGGLRGSQLSSSSSTSSQESEMTMHLNEHVTLYFRPFVDDFPVEQSSAGCAAVGLCTPGENLCDFVKGKSEEFVECVQNLVNEWSTSRAVDTSYRVDSLRLRPPRLRQARVELRVQVELSMDHNAGIEDPKAWTVKACLYDIKKVVCLAPPQRPPRRPPDGRAGSSAAAPRGCRQMRDEALSAAGLEGAGAPAADPEGAGPLQRRRPPAESHQED